MPHGDDRLPIDKLRAWLDVYGERLLRSAFLLSGDQMEAEDLVQDTFLEAFKSRRQFRGDCAVYTWLHGILINLSRHYWRKRKRVVLDDRPALQLACEESSVANADREFQSSRLVQALLALSPEHREVIVLRYYEDRKLQEIAVQTGASLGTVKSRLHYAVRALKRLLPEEMNFFASQGTYQGLP